MNAARLPRPTARAGAPGLDDTAPGFGPGKVVPRPVSEATVAILSSLEESAEASVARYLLGKGEDHCVNLAIAMLYLEG